MKYKRGEAVAADNYQPADSRHKMLHHIEIRGLARVIR